MLSHVQLFVMQWSLSGSSVLGILQARIFEWIAIASPRKTFKPRDKTHLSCIDKWILILSKSPGKTATIEDISAKTWLILIQPILITALDKNDLNTPIKRQKLSE